MVDHRRIRISGDDGHVGGHGGRDCLGQHTGAGRELQQWSDGQAGEAARHVVRERRQQDGREKAVMGRQVPWLVERVFTSASSA